MSKDFSNAAYADLKRGYTGSLAEGQFACLFCGDSFQVGEIYKVDGHLYEAQKAVEAHICDEHESVFDCLMAADKKETGLTDVQKELMSLFYRGLGDKDIATKTRTSPSTVRFQRHHFRERARQAKMYLAIAELMEDSLRLNKNREEVVPLHAGATMVDERYMVTQKEADTIMEKYAVSLNPLRLSGFPAKEKRKLVLLRHIAAQFTPGQVYKEKQINEALAAIYEDFATLRRYLIAYGFMARTTDCAEYWLKTEEDGN